MGWGGIFYRKIFLEGLRIDSLMSGSFRIVQLASLAGVLLSAVVEFIILLVSFVLVKVE